MGARGPRADADQAAKGFPGRRRGKAKEAAAEARRLSKLLAAPAGGVQVEPPRLLLDRKYRAALAVWQRMAPNLRSTHRLPAEAELQFAQLCIYVQEWTEATEDLHTHGFTQDVETVAGGTMERRRPATFDRQQAFQNIMLLSAKFGLTPMDMVDVFKGYAIVAPQNPGLFGAPQAQLPLDDEAEDGAQTGMIGAMGRMRSIPPPDTMN